jgi:DNA replication regulator SLD2
MDEAERKQYEATAQELRAHLKRFEGDWAQQHGGAKPGRDDIKRNPDMALKYKKYNQVRDILSGKVQPSKPKPRKRKSGSDEIVPSQTPSKRAKAVETPSKARHSAPEMDSMLETPSNRKLFSPAVPTSIGPTPQRDGRVLGLFDLLVETDENTPSRARQSDVSGPEVSIHATPSKKHTATDADETRLGRTPMSTSKRAMLDTFLTPLKPRDGNARVHGTPTSTSVSKLQFATPAFLRRAPLTSVDENGAYKSPAPLRLPRKPFGRGLSSVLANLRKLEEEQLDDDLEALRDMENDTGTSRAEAKIDAPIPDSQTAKSDKPTQVPRLLSGFDDDAAYDSPVEDGNSQPQRVYKKKGQKRTTRRVNMKPTRVKRPQDTNDEDRSDDDDHVPETQVVSNAAESVLDHEGSERDDDGIPSKSKAAQGRKRDGGKQQGEGKIQKAARKVNALAHTNFKRLKLRNSGAKGGPGFGSRFRRRR